VRNDSPRRLRVGTFENQAFLREGIKVRRDGLLGAEKTGPIRAR